LHVLKNAINYYFLSRRASKNDS